MIDVFTLFQGPIYLQMALWCCIALLGILGIQDIRKRRVNLLIAYCALILSLIIPIMRYEIGADSDKSALGWTILGVGVLFFFWLFHRHSPNTVPLGDALIIPIPFIILGLWGWVIAAIGLCIYLWWGILTGRAFEKGGSSMVPAAAATALPTALALAVSGGYTLLH